jgi:Putative zinc-finger
VRPDRDDGLGSAMRRALQDSGTDCPDVNVLAAYAERTLSATERRGVERHLSRCARCRETLILTSRAAATEKETATFLQEAKKGSSPLYWLAGAVAAGLAIALWIAQPGREAPTRAPDVASQIAQAERPAPPPRLEPAPVRPQQEAKDTAAPPATRERGARERNRAADATMKRSRDERKLEQSAGQPSVAERVVVAPPAAAAPTTAAPPPPPALPAPAPAAPPESTAQASARAKRAEKEAERQVFAGQDRRYGEARESVVVSWPPSTDRLAAMEAPPAIAWRVWTSGRVERSTDGGVTWSREPIEAPAARAISAPSRDVCWIVGEAGLILRYEAARGWTRLSPPLQAGFVAVQARDAMQATITAGDGRRFTTADGGQTWK